MKEPTEAQIKEFWEWCGFTFIMDYDDPTRIEESRSPIGERIFPPIDLKNLFKYAVPKDYQQIIFQPDGYCGLTVDDELYEAEGDTADLALFWAIKESL